MRLINVNDYSITQFIGQNVPLYAILSHTWGDGEVSLQDMQNLNAASLKEGFKKIKFCCNQAKEDNLQWIWVDTCCIDKTSSAELSEAINSMFRWYSRSMVCYTYLSDVSFSYHQRPEEFDLNALRKSRWFTRGWTLQELLAPLVVQFFSSNWSYIGSKKRLAPLIGQITGIPMNILNHEKSILDETVYQRMHWASKRQTSREEDMAYCLLGLFDVNLPLLYGEGKKSFYRLQEEILKQFNDHTMFVWDIYPARRRREERDVLSAKKKFYAGLLAESPHQFSNPCAFKRPWFPDSREPTQISRKGSQMKLYLKKVTPKCIASWPSFIPDKLWDLHLAALDCIIKDVEYITESSFLEEQYGQLECSAMLLLRRSDGTYERVLSYYETVSFKEVRAKWKLTSCYITNPTWQGGTFLQHDPMAELIVRWTGSDLGYSIIEKRNEREFAIFLLSERSKPATGLFIIVLCSCNYSINRCLLDVRWQENQPGIPRPNLEKIVAENYRDWTGATLRHATGPMLQEIFLVKDKEMVLTLAGEQSANDLVPGDSRRIWTLWLSFRQPLNNSISDNIVKALPAGKGLCASWDE